jgi:hypothetical protein
MEEFAFCIRRGIVLSEISQDEDSGIYYNDVERYRSYNLKLKKNHNKYIQKSR